VIGQLHARSAARREAAVPRLPPYLAGLTKRRVRAVAQALGAEDAIVDKVPTADLDSERPGLPDEHVFGITYERIDDFLEGREVAPEVHGLIVSAYRRTAHKRALPAAP
jgi:NAD+ synthase